MRTSLRWALAAAAGTAAAVTQLPDHEADVVVPAITRSAAAGPAASTMLPLQAQGSLPRPETPTRAAVAPVATPAGPATPADPRADWPALSNAARSAWVPRQPPSPAPAPASAAASTPAPPPAFPYQWLGEIEDDGQTRIFIANPQRVLAVVPGEVLEQSWRVEGVEAGRLQLTWLATGATVTLAARP